MSWTQVMAEVEPCARCGHDHSYLDTENGHQTGPMIECYDCLCPGYRSQRQVEAWEALRRLYDKNRAGLDDAFGTGALKRIMELYP